MKNIYQKIKDTIAIKRMFNEAKKTTLSNEEKNTGRENLVAFMEKHPVRLSKSKRHNLQRSLNPISNLQLTHSIKPMPLLLTIALIFSMGGGVSLAAQDALPNDALYPVKVGVNERVESALAFDNENKAEIALEKAELRLQEAETLAIKGELDNETTSKIETRFDSKISHLEKLQARLKAEGRTEAASQIQSRIEAMLEMHEIILANLQSQIENTSEENEDSIIKIKAKIKNKVKAASDAQDVEEGDEDENEEDSDDEEENETEDNENRMQAAASLMSVAESKFKRTTQFKNRVQTRLQAQSNEDAEVYLSTAEELIAEGKAEFDAENYQKAFLTFHQALRSTQKAHSLIATSIHLGIDLRGGLDDDESEEEENEGEEEQEEENNENNESEDEDESDENEKDEEGSEEEDDENKFEAETEVDVELGPSARLNSRSQATVNTGL